MHPHMQCMLEATVVVDFNLLPALKGPNAPIIITIAILAQVAALCQQREPQQLLLACLGGLALQEASLSVSALRCSSVCPRDCALKPCHAHVFHPGSKLHKMRGCSAQLRLLAACASCRFQTDLTHRR